MGYQTVAQNNIITILGFLMILLHFPTVYLSIIMIHLRIRFFLSVWLITVLLFYLFNTALLSIWLVTVLLFYLVYYGSSCPFIRFFLSFSLIQYILFIRLIAFLLLCLVRVNTAFLIVLVYYDSSYPFG